MLLDLSLLTKTSCARRWRLCAWGLAVVAAAGLSSLSLRPPSAAENRPVGEKKGTPATDRERLVAAVASGDLKPVRGLAQRIAEQDGQKAIPFLIGVIDADNSQETLYDVGHFGLAMLTEVKYSAFHDGAWWRRWWQANREQFPDDVKTIPIPSFEKTRDGRRTTPFPYGQIYMPFPEDIDTLQGKLRLAAEVLDGWKAYRKDGRARPRVLLSRFAQEVAKHEDPHAIPYLIGLVEGDKTAIYDVGHYGLGHLTGVEYSGQHDGAWWRRWWQENKAKYPADVQAIEIPDYRSPLTFAWKEQTEEEKKQAAMADVTDVPAQDLTVAGNNNMRYFLIGPRENAIPPKNGFKLVVVLPGGDGSAAFHPFVRRLYKYAMSEEYLVAQPVAVRWTFGQKVVWPTKSNPEKEQQFATEDFVEAVVEDVSRRQPIDKRFVFTLAWSSSGPAAYAIALQEKTAVTGSYIAMSVYRPEWHPPVERAKGRAFLIDHSPQDKICAYTHAETAQRELLKAGARVRLVTYEGGHGWRGERYRRVSDGLSWLVGQSSGREE